MRRYAENGGAALLRFSAFLEKSVGVVKITPHTRETVNAPKMP